MLERLQYRQRKLISEQRHPFERLRQVMADPHVGLDVDGQILSGQTLHWDQCAGHIDGAAVGMLVHDWPPGMAAI